MQHMKMRVGQRHRVGTLTGPIGAVVINNQDVGVRNSSAHFAHHDGEIPQFVVGRNEDQSGHASTLSEGASVRELRVGLKTQ